jgi:hypothetical protein
MPTFTREQTDELNALSAQCFNGVTSKWMRFTDRYGMSFDEVKDWLGKLLVAREERIHKIAEEAAAEIKKEQGE